jgi:hypothetical protein
MASASGIVGITRDRQTGRPPALCDRRSGSGHRSAPGRVARLAALECRLERRHGARRTIARGEQGRPKIQLAKDELLEAASGPHPNALGGSSRSCFR